jgi:hypothetical protein
VEIKLIIKINLNLEVITDNQGKKRYLLWVAKESNIGTLKWKYFLSEKRDIYHFIKQ